MKSKISQAISILLYKCEKSSLDISILKETQANELEFMAYFNYNDKPVRLGFRLDCSNRQYFVYTYPESPALGIEFLDLPKIHTRSLNEALGYFNSYLSIAEKGILPSDWILPYKRWEEETLCTSLPPSLQHATLIYEVTKGYVLRDKGGCLLKVRRGLYSTGKEDNTIEFNSPAREEFVRISKGEITQRESSKKVYPRQIREELSLKEICKLISKKSKKKPKNNSYSTIHKRAFNSSMAR